MVSAGLSAEQIGDVCAAIEEGFSKPVPPLTAYSIAMTPAERQRRYRARNKPTVTPTVTNERDASVTEREHVPCEERVFERNASRDAVTDAVTVDAEILPQEKVSHTLPKESPFLPSGDKSPSGDSPGAHTREAPPEPDFDEPSLAEPAVVDAEFEDVAAVPGELFAAPARTALVVVAPKRARRGATPPLDEAAFDRFWSLYPRKVAKDRAKVAFAKACGRVEGPDPPIEAILRGLEGSIRFWRNKGTETEYLPHPATWLNDSRWNDELDANAGIGARQSEQDRRLQQMVGGAALLADRIRRRQGGG